MPNEKEPLKENEYDENKYTEFPKIVPGKPFMIRRKREKILKDRMNLK